MTMATIEKEVLTTREAWEMCGGRPTFERLQKQYPSLVTPFSTGKPTNGKSSRGKTTYLKSIILQALKAAQLDRSFAK
jgi:hypothetical protein